MGLLFVLFLGFLGILKIDGQLEPGRPNVCQATVTELFQRQVIKSRTTFQEYETCCQFDFGQCTLRCKKTRTAAVYYVENVPTYRTVFRYFCCSGWSQQGVSCLKPICSTPCKNGHCSEPQKCTCNAGWNGILCEVAICDQPCQNGGRCLSPNHCTCSTGYKGTSCEEIICYPSCQNGQCLKPNVCTCDMGYIGDVCQTPVCDLPCQNGQCTKPNTCSCDSGWSGAQCRTAICNPPCHRNARCVMPGRCLCDLGYYRNGKICLKATCSKKCVHGWCIGLDKCMCEKSYTGDLCETKIIGPYCNPVCKNGGRCTSNNYCECPKGYSGLICGVKTTTTTTSNNGSQEDKINAWSLNSLAIVFLVFFIAFWVLIICLCTITICATIDDK